METFLIIDDDKIDRMIIERAFSARYPDVVCLQAESIMTALDVAKKTKIDHFLIDMSLSDGTGFECKRALEEELERSSLPISFMSGAVKPSDSEEAWASGGLEIFLKPMRRSENEKFVDKIYTVYKSASSTNRAISAN